MFTFLDSTTILLNQNDNRQLDYFGGTNYLGLSHHPEMLAAACNAIAKLGLTISASRKTTGTTSAHLALEKSLSDFTECESALVLGSGYLSNAAVMDILNRHTRMWLIDELSHPSFTSRIHPDSLVIRYAHANSDDFEAKRRALPTNASYCVFTDGLFPVTGKLPPIETILGNEDDFCKWILVDEGHSLGVIGQNGQGVCAGFAGASSSKLIRTGTLSKSLGCYGGVVLAPTNFINEVENHSVTFAASSALPPFYCETAIKALDLIKQDAGFLARLRNNVSAVRDCLSNLGVLSRSEEIPIFCIDNLSTMSTERLHQYGIQKGVFVPIVRDYPGFGSNKPVLRLAVQAIHSKRQIAHLCEILESWTLR